MDGDRCRVCGLIGGHRLDCVLGSGSTGQEKVARTNRPMVSLPADQLKEMKEKAREWSRAPLKGYDWLQEKVFLDIQIVQWMAEQNIPGRSGPTQRRAFLKQFLDSAADVLASLAKLRAEELRGGEVGDE